MVTEMKLVERSERPLSMHPKKFAMWLFMVTIAMLFAAFTSAYLVRQGEGNWMFYELPKEFFITTAILILSSLTMHYSYINAKKDNIKNVKLGLGLSVVLGLVFLIGQYFIWNILVNHEVYFVGNPSGSFLYVLTGIHGVHLVSGIIFMIITLVKAYKYKIHSKNLTTLQMCASYWHFLDGLWVYLLIFLLLNHN